MQAVDQTREGALAEERPIELGGLGNLSVDDSAITRMFCSFCCVVSLCFSCILHVSAPPRRGATHPVTTAGRQLPTFKQMHQGVAPPAHPWGENMLPVSMARGGTLLHQTLKQTLELADRCGSFNNALRQMIVHSNQSEGTT